MHAQLHFLAKADPGKRETTGDATIIAVSLCNHFRAEVHAVGYAVLQPQPCPVTAILEYVARNGSDTPADAEILLPVELHFRPELLAPNAARRYIGTQPSV